MLKLSTLTPVVRPITFFILLLYYLTSSYIGRTYEQLSIGGGLVSEVIFSFIRSFLHENLQFQLKTQIHKLYINRKPVGWESSNTTKSPATGRLTMDGQALLTVICGLEHTICMMRAFDISSSSKTTNKTIIVMQRSNKQYIVKVKK